MRSSYLLLPKRVKKLNVSLVELKKYDKDFPGGPVAKTPWVFPVQGVGSIPGQGTKPHMLQLKTQHATTKDSMCCS